MAHLSKLKVFQDAVVNKMVQDSVRDQNKYFSSFNNIQRISDHGSSYLSRVSEVRQNISKLKSGMVEKNLQVINAFNQQLKKKKALYILQKIEKKYGSVVKYVINGLNNIPVKNLKDIYQVFVVTMINVKEDRAKYRALVFLKKFEDSVENNLIKLRKKLRNLLYENVRHISQKYRESQAESVMLANIVELKAVYSSIALSAIKLSQRSNCPDTVKNTDKHLFETHLDFIFQSDKEVRWVCNLVKEKILKQS